MSNYCALCRTFVRVKTEYNIANDVCICSKCRSNVELNATKNIMCNECDEGKLCVYTLHQDIFKGKPKGFIMCRECTADCLSGDDPVRQNQIMNLLTALIVKPIETQIKIAHPIQTNWSDDDDAFQNESDDDDCELVEQVDDSE